MPPSPPLRIGVAGALGRMGRAVTALVDSRPDLELAALFDRPECAGSRIGERGRRPIGAQADFDRAAIVDADRCAVGTDPLQPGDHVATLWLDRPEARNALGSAFWRDLPLACRAVSLEKDVRALVIAAKGPHFSVGLDLKEFGGNLAGSDASGSRATSNATSAKKERRSVPRASR